VTGFIEKHAVVSTLSILGVVTFCHALTISGTVFNTEKPSEPIKNAAVSLGYSSSRTMTDAYGHFLFTLQAVAALPRLQTLTDKIKVRWDLKKGILDFSHADGITACRIYGVNGALLYTSDVPSTNRLIRLSHISSGIVIVRLFNGNHLIAAFRSVVFSGGGPTTTDIIVDRSSITSAGASLDKSSTAAAGLAEKLLFRHDDFLPCDTAIAGSPENVVVQMAPDLRSEVFDVTKINSYYFTMTREDSLSMERNALLEEYVPATFVCNTTAYNTVGLRYKGSDYSLPNCVDSTGSRKAKPECAKLSLKVKFDAYNPDARFYAMKRLNLHAMSGDPTKMHEILSYALFREMGVYTSRTAYAKVYINGIFQGLFLAVEEIDGRFTKSRWPRYGDGNLYKEEWPRYGTPQPYRTALETNAGATTDVSRMIAFYQAIKSATEASFRRDISPFMDLNYWLRYIAVDRATHNADGFTTWYYQNGWSGNHNYFFYEEETPGGKFWLLPWDLHETLARTDPIIDNFSVPEWNVKPSSCNPLPIWGDNLGIPANCDKLTSLTASVLWNEFVAIGEELLSTCFKSDRLLSKVDAHTSLIGPVVANDPGIDYARWQGEVKSLRQTIPILSRTFNEYLHGITNVIDASAYSKPFPGDGFLLTNTVNNFEFTPVIPLSLWSNASISKGSTINAKPDRITPLWGAQDFKASFIFRPSDTTRMYAEYSGVRLFFSQATDISTVTRINVNLKADSPRSCWVHLASDIYKQNSVAEEYGWFINVDATNKIYALDMDAIGYPMWGDPNNPELLDKVLAVSTGVTFDPSPRYNSAGRLAVVPDTGYLRIDNIVFEK
jgi:hypothetical protein